MEELPILCLTLSCLFFITIYMKFLQPGLPRDTGHQRPELADSPPWSQHQGLEFPLVLLTVKVKAIHDLVLLLRGDEIFND